MNKYNEAWYKNEMNFRVKREIFIKKLSLKLYKYIYSKYGINNVINFFKEYRFNLALSAIFDINFYDKELRDWIKNNITSFCNKEYIMRSFIQSLNYYLVEDNLKALIGTMNSFKQSGLIKNIELKDNIFHLTTLDNKIIKFTKGLNNIEQIKESLGRCHSICYFSLKHFNDQKSYCVTVLEKNIADGTQYHTFLVNDGLVQDLSRNLIMKFEDYKSIFKPKIIMYVKGKTMLENIEKIERRDKDFHKLNNYCKVLKYSIRKQMKKDRK